MPDLTEQARERATEIRTTTVWNGRGTADLLDALADETERLQQFREGFHALQEANAVLADQLAAWHDMKPDLTRLFAAEKVVEAARGTAEDENGITYVVDPDALAQALQEYDDGRTDAQA